MMYSMDALLAWVDELEDLMGTQMFLMEFVGNLSKWNQYKIACQTVNCPFTIKIFYRLRIKNDLKLEEIFEVDGDWRLNHWHCRTYRKP